MKRWLFHCSAPRLVLLFCLVGGNATTLYAAGAMMPACPDDAVRQRCGNWALGGYYSLSPAGDWFAGVSAGGEYFAWRDLSLGASLSPGFGEGYFYLAPSFEVNYYLWHNPRWELVAGYSFRYFYDWPLRAGDGESDGTFHGPGVSVLYGLTEQLYTGFNLSYQWIQFAGEHSREWYFTLPVYWVL